MYKEHVRDLRASHSNTSAQTTVMPSQEEKIYYRSFHSWYSYELFQAFFSLMIPLVRSEAERCEGHLAPRGTFPFTVCFLLGGARAVSWWHREPSWHGAGPLFAVYVLACSERSKNGVLSAPRGREGRGGCFNLMVWCPKKSLQSVMPHHCNGKGGPY